MPSYEMSSSHLWGIRLRELFLVLIPNSKKKINEDKKWPKTPRMEVSLRRNPSYFPWLFESIFIMQLIINTVDCTRSDVIRFQKPEKGQCCIDEELLATKAPNYSNYNQ